MSIEAKINYQLNKCPVVKKTVKRIYQRTAYAISPKIKSEGNIVKVSPDDPEHEYFFGYYDKSPWDMTDRYMICMKANNTWDDVSPKEDAEIILIDTARENKITILARTKAWNVQQGCMAQWLGPDYSSRMIYNDYRDGKYCSVIVELKMDDGDAKVISETVIPVPVYSVSADGLFALTLDFSRLYRLRPGYGYHNVPEKTADEKLPDTPCIWRVDLKSGKTVPVLKYTDFAEFEPRPEMEGAEHKVNHIMLNPKGNRFMVLHRWFKGGRKYTRLVTCNVDGSDLYNLSDDDMVSHCYWRTDKQIFAFENKKNGYSGDKGGNGYYLMKDRTQEYRRFWPGIDYDGHPSYSPDGSRVVFDRYPDRMRMAAVMVSDAKNRENSKVQTLARVFAPFKYDNDTRCDLHPRWNRAGNSVCFDSVFEGHRGLYIVKADRIDRDIKKAMPESLKQIGQPLISVIIPVYNVEKYLIRCVNSVRKQTYRNLEIILVDDGSTDGSGKLCDKLENEDPRIQVIHKENGGLSSARNAGLEAAGGKFIGFVDSDDWIARDTYEYLLNLLIDNRADIAQIDFKYASEYTMSVSNEKEEIKVFRDKAILQNYMTTTTTTTGSYSVCRCLFKKSVLEGIVFRVGKINEDIDYKYKALSGCGKYVESNLKKYFYFQSTGSLTTSGLTRRDFDLYDAAESIYNLTKNEIYGTIAFLGEVKKARTAFSLLCRIAYYGVSDTSINRNSIVRKLTREHRKNLGILLCSPMKMSRKLIAVGLAVHISTVEWPITILQKIKIIR